VGLSSKQELGIINAAGIPKTTSYMALP